MTGGFDREPGWQQSVSPKEVPRRSPRPDAVSVGGAQQLLQLQGSCGNETVLRILEQQRRPDPLFVQRYALARVPYKGNEFSWQAVALRAAHQQGLRNIASIKLTGMDMFTAASIPPGKKGVTPKHSEQVVWESVASQCTSGVRKIEWVYTEREPCGVGPGMKNCASFLARLLALYGVAGDQTPVYYSFNYPARAEVKEAAEWLLSQNVVDDWDDAFDAAYDLWIQEHGDTKRMKAEAQEMFSTPGPWAASAFK